VASLSSGGDTPAQLGAPPVATDTTPMDPDGAQGGDDEGANSGRGNGNGHGNGNGNGNGNGRGND